MNYKTLTQPCALYIEAHKKWHDVRLAIAGKNAIDNVVLGAHHSTMTSPEYKSCAESTARQRVVSYWKRARYLNATAQTQRALDGFIWSSDPEVGDLPDIGGIEKNLKRIAKICTLEVMATGRYGLLVDIMDFQGGTIAESEKVKPYVSRYKAENIILCKDVNDKIVDVRLIENYEQCDDSLQYKTMTRCRRLYIDNDGYYAVSVYCESGDEQHYSPKINGSRIDYIPFVVIGADNNLPQIGAVPLYDLASENLGHYRLSADNLDNLHYHGQGMTNVYTSMTSREFDERNPKGLDVGAGGRNLLEQGDRVEVLQIAATGAIPAEMERVERRMIMAGALLVTNQQSNQTLGAKKIEFAASTSTLKNIADNISDAMEQVIEWLALFSGQVVDPTYRLNTQFMTDQITAQELQNMLAAVQGSVLPESVYWDAMRKRGFTSLEDDEIREKIAEQVIAIAPINEDVSQ